MMGDRLKRLRKKAGLTQVQLAEKVETSQQTIQRIESGVIENTSLLKDFAKLFNVDIAWLQFGKGEDPFMTKRLSNGYIPLISWNDVFEWVSSEEHERVDILGSVTTPDFKNPNKRYFALKVADKSMLDKAQVFKPGTILIVDPTPSTRDIKDGDYIIYGMPDMNGATLRKMSIIEKKAYLEPLNPNYETKPLPRNFLLFGLVIEVRTQLKVH